MGRGVSESGPNNAMGPWAPGKRQQWGYPPPACTSWVLTGWADPE